MNAQVNVSVAFNIDASRAKFVKGVKSAYEGDAKAIGGIQSAAEACVETADGCGYGTEWTTMHATKLPLYLREYHIGMTAFLTEKGHSNPRVYWKRIREAVEAIYAARVKAAAQERGEAPAAEEVESEREKLRRLTEEGIQSLYGRIKKASASIERDADLDIMALMPALRDMADSIGYTLVEPGAK